MEASGTNRAEQLTPRFVEPSNPAAATAPVLKPAMTPPPRPLTTKRAPKPSQAGATTRKTTKTTTKDYALGIHPGAFCAEHWAFGLTDNGTLMQCKPSATDSYFRWRAA